MFDCEKFKGKKSSPGGGAVSLVGGKQLSRFFNIQTNFQDLYIFGCSYFIIQRVWVKDEEAESFPD